MSFSETKIAIVGAGPGGMVALKELRELGFDVTLFERRSEVGGIWTWTDDTSATAALRETTLCNNKYSLALGDYPLPKDFPWVVTAPKLGSYFQSYAKHHDLYRNIQFGKTITKLTRDEQNQRWQLTFADGPSTPHSFDKVVWATGAFVKPKPITFSGQEAFQGRIMHSQNVRDFSTFKGQNVVVLGIGNTAADISNALVHHGAGRVYLSHRRGAKIVSPVDKKSGMPVDVVLNTKMIPMTWWLQAKAPSVYGYIMDSAVAQSFKDNWGVNKPEWNLEKSLSIGQAQHVIVCSQDLVPNIKAGKIDSVPNIKRITGPKTVELDDGRVLEDIDAIIACVGYDDDLELLRDAIEFAPSPNDTPPIPRLYMNIFPPKYANSFAYLSLTHLFSGQIPGRELAAMALAQIWAGRSALPPPSTMDAWIAKHHTWLRARILRAPNGNRYADVMNGEWSTFMHEAAGTGLYEHLGWGWKAWGFWWRDRELYRAVGGIPQCTYTYRLFDMGKRRPYEGARQAILDAYKDFEDTRKGKGGKKA